MKIDSKPYWTLCLNAQSINLVTVNIDELIAFWCHSVNVTWMLTDFSAIFIFVEQQIIILLVVLKQFYSWICRYCLQLLNSIVVYAMSQWICYNIPFLSNLNGCLTFFFLNYSFVLAIDVSKIIFLKNLTKIVIFDFDIDMFLRKFRVNQSDYFNVSACLYEPLKVNRSRPSDR